MAFRYCTALDKTAPEKSFQAIDPFEDNAEDAMSEEVQFVHGHPTAGIPTSEHERFNGISVSKLRPCVELPLGGIGNRL